MFIITESSALMQKPKIVGGKNKRNLVCECILQTAGDVNRNRRIYPKGLLEEGVASVRDRFQEGNMLGELDHPVDTNPVRQSSVMLSDVSHRILETSWDGNKLVGVVETLTTPKGKTLRGLIEDGVPVGFSFRGMGELRPVQEAGQMCYQVAPPLKVVTWDSVSIPSHKEAKIIRITESVQNQLVESAAIVFEQEAGIVFLPDDMNLINKRIDFLKNIYRAM